MTQYSLSDVAAVELSNKTHDAERQPTQVRVTNLIQLPSVWKCQLKLRQGPHALDIPGYRFADYGVIHGS